MLGHKDTTEKQMRWILAWQINNIAEKMIVLDIDFYNIHACTLQIQVDIFRAQSWCIQATGQTTIIHNTRRASAGGKLLNVVGRIESRVHHVPQIMQVIEK